MKNKEWLKEQLSYLQDGVGESFNDLSKGLNIAYNTLELLINQLEEPEQEKVVIPQFVADWIEKNRNKTTLLGTRTMMIHRCINDDPRVLGWVDTNMDLFSRAWLDGYSVEKEKLYYVRENNYLLCKYNDEVIDYVEAVEREITDLVKLKLTEQEIKDYDERFWAFTEEITK